MQILKERIIKDGLALGTEILKVDSFLNHQIDPRLMEQIGAEFRLRFDDVAEKIDKILTVEASGIAVAMFAARHFDYPQVVFAKKEQPSTMNEGYYAAEVRSFTKNIVSSIRIADKYLSSGENVLIIDDFLAHGEAGTGLVDLVRQAGANVVGMGIVIEKEFQGGGHRIREKGVRVESLAVVKKIADGVIYF
ncbi:MAG: xanthine phosphoribosyltransferase [Clostridiales Family XIII bacterium]|jgi:xanthine phosphoribosyltransferase|nr:xanthine phosphoribosyltransferase [Clostridiales Family XIII bacterium]